MRTIDLNCDLGEGAGHDAELMPLITSANIACGAHAGDEATMRATVALARRHGVAVGAHPGFADRGHFGRRERVIAPTAAGDLVVLQVRRLQVIAHELGTPVHHVKLHGALYNQASRDGALAEGIVRALGTTGRHLRLYVLAGSVLEAVARARGDIVVVPEVFADRAYQADGSLTPRTAPGAVIAEPAAAAAQACRLAGAGRVRAADGTEVPVTAGTICLHGDGATAVATAAAIRRALLAAGVRLAAP